MASNGDTVRSLHWVFKVGDLRQTLTFFKNVLGMHVLRHEEFSSGCEATCNGPYAGSWSKTMVGHGEESKNFVFELTYNYGVDSYKMGHDLRCITVACTRSSEDFVPFQISHIKKQAERFGFRVNEPDQEIDDPNTICVIEDANGYFFKFVALADDGALELKRDPVQCVSLWVTDLEKSKKFWCDTLGAQLFQENKQNKTALIGFGSEDYCQLELVQIRDPESPVSHGQAFGRIAFSTRNGPQKFYEAVRNAQLGDVINEPMTLSTPGKADVHVTILSDPDGYEICFVGEEGFDDLSTLRAGMDFIDWDAREVRDSDIQKRQQKEKK